MNRESEITVVIPVYNREKLIVRTLDSVFAQTARPLRVVVVDNNSSDATVSVIKSWAQDEKVKNDTGFSLSLFTELTPGAAAARNRGLREVHTPWVLFFDSDDEMHPELTEEARNAISDETDVVNWGADRILLSGEKRAMATDTSNMLAEHLYRGLFATQTYMVRTDFLKAIGAWDEKMLVWDDWELGLRLLLASPRCVTIHRSLVRINAQEDSITGTGFMPRHGQWESTIHTMRAKARKALCSPDLEKPTDKAQKLLQRIESMLDYRIAVLAAHYRREGFENEAEELWRALIKSSRLSSLRKIWLRFLYRYTAAGGRGAYLLWDK